MGPDSAESLRVLPASVERWRGIVSTVAAGAVGRKRQVDDPVDVTLAVDDRDVVLAHDARVAARAVVDLRVRGRRRRAVATVARETLWVVPARRRAVARAGPVTPAIDASGARMVPDRGAAVRGRRAAQAQLGR